MALTQFQDTEQINKDVDTLASELEKLRLAYEQYFLGLERKEPIIIRSRVQDLIRKYSGAAIKNVRTKFRYQQTVARYNVYALHWDRILREIEDGKYERDVFKAKMHEAQRLGMPKEKEKPAAKAAPVDPMEAIFDQYVSMRKKNKEAVEGLTLQNFKKTLTAQIETIKQQTKATGVRFQIVTEAGKTKIKAVPQMPKKG